MKTSCLSIKKKLFYVIFILFYGFYGSAYAADDVKALRDKCRASYNDFMHALKENTDQESINQLATKYKSDYATYQKALKSLSALSNKNDASIKPLSNASYQSNSEPATTIKRDIPKDMYKKPMRITNAPFKSPQRINEPPATSTVDDFEPTPLPSDEELLNGDTSGEKLYYIKEIKRMNDEVINNEYCYLDGNMKGILLSASKFPDICALAILYNVEGEIKKMVKLDYLNVSPTVAISILERALTLQNMLTETVDTYSQGSKVTSKVCQNVVDAISKPGGRLTVLKECILKQKNVMALNIKNADSLIDKTKKELVDFQTNIYNANNRPTSVQINERCNGIITAYSTIICSNLALGNYEEAKKYRDKLDDFYKNKLSGPYVIRYKQNSDQTVTEKIYITKNPHLYVYAKFEYFDTLFKGENESLDYELLKSELKEFSDYSEGIPHAGEYDIPIPWYKTMAPDLLNNISQPYTISNLKVMKNGKIINSGSEEIYESEGTFTLKFRANRNITGKAIEATLESSASKRPLTLKFKRSNFFDTSNYCDYYATFMPSDGPDATTNLINNVSDNQKESIACSRCENNLQTPLLLYQNTFFKNNLGRTDFDHEQIKKGNADYLNASSFLKSGGAESVTICVDGTETKILIRNQADWFIIQGHGNLLTGSIGEIVTASNRPVIVTPNSHTTEKFKVKNDNNQEITRTIEVAPLIKKDGESEFSEDINVLVLAACDCLGTPKTICAWHKTLKVTGEDKIILGYKGKVKNYVIVRVLTGLNNIIKNNPNITKKTIGFYWETLNYEYNNSCWTPITAWMYGSYHMAYIYSDVYYYCHTSKVIGPLSGYTLSPAYDTDLYLIEELDPKSEESI